MTADCTERGRVDAGADVGRHELVTLPLAGAAPVGLDLGDRQQHVGVDAGHRAGLERERDQGGRGACELRAEAGRAGAAGREQGGREDDEGEDAGAGQACELHGRGPRSGATAALLALPDGRRIGDWVNPQPVGAEHAMGFMQFLPSTWRIEAAAAPSGPRDPYRPLDAMVAAGSYLHRIEVGAVGGGQHDLRGALAVYGGSTAYADQVLALAEPATSSNLPLVLPIPAPGWVQRIAMPAWPSDLAAHMSMASPRTCSHDGDQHATLSGTQMRRLLAAGQELPQEFTRPEVAGVLLETSADRVEA